MILIQCYYLVSIILSVGKKWNVTTLIWPGVWHFVIITLYSPASQAIREVAIN